MSRGSIREYAEAIRQRYRKAGREEKGKMLEEFAQVTGYHRKAVIRLLARERMGLLDAEGAVLGCMGLRW